MLPNPHEDVHKYKHFQLVIISYSLSKQKIGCSCNNNILPADGSLKICFLHLFTRIYDIMVIFYLILPKSHVPKIATHLGYIYICIILRKYTQTYYSSRVSWNPCNPLQHFLSCRCLRCAVRRQSVKAKHTHLTHAYTYTSCVSVKHIILLLTFQINLTISFLSIRAGSLCVEIFMTV